MLLIVGLILAVIAGLVCWQQLRYLRIRRNSAQDMQNPLHSIDAFHVIVFFKLHSGDKVVDTLRRFNQLVLPAGGGRLIYAGQAAYATPAEQLPESDFDGVILFEYPSRLTYQEDAAWRISSAGAELFSSSYVHGLRRNRNVSFSVPNKLLRQRIRQLLNGQWRPAPLEPARDFFTSPDMATWHNRIDRLKALQEINSAGLVTYNLIKNASGRKRLASDHYWQSMVSLMSAPAHGPLHIGRSIALEGNARFDHVYVVHYPSAEYLAQLLASGFYQGIARNRQLADSISIPTIPITGLLQDLS